MSNSAKKEYLIKIRKRYFTSTEAEKSLIHDELFTVCGFYRKYAIRFIYKQQVATNRKKGRPGKYNSQAILIFLKDLWLKTNPTCSERQKAVNICSLPG